MEVGNNNGSNRRSAYMIRVRQLDWQRTWTGLTLGRTPGIGPTKLLSSTKTPHFFDERVEYLGQGKFVRLCSTPLHHHYSFCMAEACLSTLQLRPQFARLAPATEYYCLCLSLCIIARIRLNNKPAYRVIKAADGADRFFYRPHHSSLHVCWLG